MSFKKFTWWSRAPVAQLDRAAGFEPVGRGFESLRAHIRGILILSFLPLCLASCALFSNSGGGGKSKKESKNGYPAVIAVLPVSNESQELTAPVLVRFFMEREAAGRGFKIPLKFDEVDDILRQMGIKEGRQINDGNIQNIGQYLKVDGVLQATLFDSRQHDGMKVSRARFRLVSVLTGQTLWEKQVEAEEKIGGRIPVRGTVSAEWTYRDARSLAKTSAGTLPRKLVRAALKSLKR